MCVRVGAAGDATGDDVRVVFEVADTGIGIEPSLLEQMFEPFRQADSSTARRFGGTGLGLPICAQLVDAMDGQMDAESTPGQGSTFRFVLPYQPAADAASGRTPDATENHRPEPVTVPGDVWVLLAEDNTVNQFLAARLLEQRGLRVDLVPDGAEAPLVDAVTLDTLAAEIGSDTVIRLLDKFRDRTPELVGRLRSAITAGDSDAAVLEAHTLKGSSASLGAARLSARGAEMEQSARADDLDAVSDVLVELDELWAATVDALDRATPARAADDAGVRRVARQLR